MRNRITAYTTKSDIRPPVARRPDLKTVGRDQAQRMLRDLGHVIARNPSVSLGVALSLGVVLGWIIKRR